MHTIHQCTLGFKSQSWYPGQPKSSLWSSAAFFHNGMQWNKLQTWNKHKSRGLRNINCWIAFITKGHIFYRFFSNQGLLEPHVFAFPIRASNRCFLYVDLLFLWLSTIFIIINVIMIILAAFASKLSSKLFLSINAFHFILHLKIELSLNLPCDTSLQSVNLKHILQQIFHFLISTICNILCIFVIKVSLF